MKRRRHGRRAPLSLPRRRPLFEELERRRMLATDFGQIASALNSQLLGVQTRLTSALNSYQSGVVSSIPLVGHTLGSESQFVNRFNAALSSSLSSLGTPNSFTDSDIQNALASGPLLPF